MAHFLQNWKMTRNRQAKIDSSETKLGCTKRYVVGNDIETTAAGALGENDMHSRWRNMVY